MGGRRREKEPPKQERAYQTFLILTKKVPPISRFFSSLAFRPFFIFSPSRISPVVLPQSQGCKALLSHPN